jgi:hypothetical protein
MPVVVVHRIAVFLVYALNDQGARRKSGVGASGWSYPYEGVGSTQVCGCCSDFEGAMADVWGGNRNAQATVVRAISNLGVFNDPVVPLYEQWWPSSDDIGQQIAIGGAGCGTGATGCVGGCALGKGLAGKNKGKKQSQK